MSEIKAGNTVKLTDRWTYTGKMWLDKYPYPSVGSVGKVAFIDEFYWCTFAGYPDGDKNLWPAHGHELEIVRPNETLEERYSNIATSVTPAPTELERLQAERKQLRDALKTVLRKANSLAGYYPEPGDERESYGMDAPIIFDDIRKVAREALEVKND